MYVGRATLENFLSYSRAEVEFTPGVNVIYGANAAGKTNLADAVYLGSLGRSSRLTKDKEMIKWGSENGFRVTLRVHKMFSSHTVEIASDGSGKKRISIDSLPVSRIGELMGAINTVFFSPGEIRLVRGAPEDRRRFLDVALSQESKTYFYTLKRYSSLLAQRNRMLKDMRGMAEIIIAKHRNGAVGDVTLRFIGQYTRFQNPDDDNMLVPPPASDNGVLVGSSMNTPIGAPSVPPPPAANDYIPSGNPFGGENNGPLPF